MPYIDRRALLCAIAGGVLAATTRPPVAAAGVLTRAPGEDNRLVLTVDDGASSPVVAAFAQFARDSGTRLTFFVNGANPSWSDNAAALRPLLDSGQVQMANHTWSHPNLNRMALTAVDDQIRRNADFLRNTYGTDGTPFFRPPFGAHNADVDRVAADQGYTSITLWSGDVGDSAPENEASLLARATKSFQPGQIVLMHANLPTITHCYGQLLDLIHSRNLQTATLREVFA
ncbi:polysaccharide deacetylase family protein [Mycobacterium sp. E796]|uniref:polysaccharide deacetylase family protein n=1 Tax=Mycobacterium sp. E796 TaxID=1834151 RepID=UPI0007FEADBA|nr:polysaccharide deacetylase family protein [Mycobacterium sp. E796]OBI60749.1 polysaccharide deacetylase [Mycobacterium sp. E796]